MSKRGRTAPGIVPGQEAGEKFMALLLWAQTSECPCPACQYLREMGRTMVQQHVKEAVSGE